MIVLNARMLKCCLLTVLTSAMTANADPSASHVDGAKILYSTGENRAPARAFALLQNAAFGGDARGHLLLSKCYQFGFDAVELNEELAIKHLRTAADLGDVVAQYYLAEARNSGVRLPVDRVKAKETLGKCMPHLLAKAENGDIEAQVAYAMSTWHGVGADRDAKVAIKWFEKAEKQGHPTARLFLAFHGEDLGVHDSKKGFQLLQMAAQQGHVFAQTEIGNAYQLGKGVEQNQATAVLWFRRAALQGFHSGQQNLGVCYELGQGVPRDRGISLKWFRKAAENGNRNAMLALGSRLLNGEDVERNDVEGASWLIRAADKGDADAALLVGLCALNGRGIEKSEVMAASYFKKGAELGDATAQYNIGLCYLKGMGVQESIQQSEHWLKKAASQGHSTAIKLLERLAEMSPDDR